MSEGAWGVPPPQGTKKRVYDYIVANPGTHVRRIGKDLGLARGVLQYHVYTLEKEGQIKMRRRGLYKFVFPSNLFGEEQEVVLSLLSQETPSEILLILVERPDSTQKELVEHLGLSPAAVSWRMEQMVEQGVVERRRVGKFVTYRAIVSPDDLLRFVERYHPTLWDRWASRFTDILLGLGREGEKEDGV